MLTFPNFLSFLRIPLACLLVIENPIFRTVSISLAIATDILDGYLARKFRQTSSFGTLLDPFTDKLFVFAALAFFLKEGRLDWWEAGAFLCRDCSVLLFSIYLWIRGEIGKYRCGAIVCGKINTALQLPILLALTWNFSIPVGFFWALVFFGVAAFVELFIEARRQRQLS